VCAEFECAIPGTVFTGDADLWGEQLALKNQRELTFDVSGYRERNILLVRFVILAGGRG
jgi:hypothetical protein